MRPHNLFFMSFFYFLYSLENINQNNNRLSLCWEYTSNMYQYMDSLVLAKPLLPSLSKLIIKSLSSHFETLSYLT